MRQKRRISLDAPIINVLSSTSRLVAARLFCYLFFCRTILIFLSLSTYIKQLYNVNCLCVDIDQFFSGMWFCLASFLSSDMKIADYSLQKLR